MAETVLAEHDLARPGPATARAAEKRPVSPNLLGRAALRIGSRQADGGLGLAPRPVGLPDFAAVATLLPPERPAHAAAILDTARGIVAWCAEREDAALAAAPAAGSARSRANNK